MHRCTYICIPICLPSIHLLQAQSKPINRAHTRRLTLYKFKYVHKCARMYLCLAELTAVNGRNECFSQILFFWLAKLFCIWQLNLKFMICHSQGMRAGTARVGSSYLKVLFSWPPSFKIICIQLKTLFCLNPWYCCFYFLYWCPNLT